MGYAVPCRRCFALAWEPLDAEISCRSPVTTRSGLSDTRGCELRLNGVNVFKLVGRRPRHSLRAGTMAQRISFRCSAYSLSRIFPKQGETSHSLNQGSISPVETQGSLVITAATGNSSRGHFVEYSP